MKSCIVLPGNQLGSGKYVKVPQMNIHWLLGLMSKGIALGKWSMKAVSEKVHTWSLKVINNPTYLWIFYTLGRKTENTYLVFLSCYKAFTFCLLACISCAVNWYGGSKVLIFADCIRNPGDTFFYFIILCHVLLSLYFISSLWSAIWYIENDFSGQRGQHWPTIPLPVFLISAPSMPCAFRNSIIAQICYDFHLTHWFFFI